MFGFSPRRPYDLRFYVSMTSFLNYSQVLAFTWLKRKKKYHEKQSYFGTILLAPFLFPPSFKANMRNNLLVTSITEQLCKTLKGKTLFLNVTLYRAVQVNRSSSWKHVTEVRRLHITAFAIPHPTVFILTAGAEHRMRTKGWGQQWYSMLKEPDSFYCFNRSTKLFQ